MTLSSVRFNSLESRIVAFFVLLLMAVQMAGFFAIRYAIEQSARNNLREELNVGVRVFKRLLEQNSQQLVEATAVLTYDFGFREAVTSQDRDTILSALSNHRARIKANGMALINLQNVVVADTLQASTMGNQFAFPELITNASDLRRSSAIRLINDTVYQIVVVPVLAPLPISWVAMSFVIDDAVADDLKRITSLDVTFIGKGNSGAAKILATTLTPFLRGEIRPLVGEMASQPETRATRALGGEEFETLSTTIERYDESRILALLQRSMRDGLRPYDRLQAILLILAALGLLVSLVGSIRIARRISRPVRALADAAREVASGRYATVAPAAMRQKDEIGELATAFDNMSRGLAERDRMRDLLGKVASPAVAEQLLKQRIELGGEERQVTVMFTDIRNFTALEIHQQIIDLGRDLAGEKLPHPAVGIGINTSRVIAGNIGTASRLNYTVLGDGVNLAARLENLTKRYQVSLIVGQETRERVPDLIYRELDKVRVKGKKVAVRIFQPLGRDGEIDAATLSTLANYHAAIEAYRNRQWKIAAEAMTSLMAVPTYQRICEIYLGYIRQFEKIPPDDNWDGSFTLYEK